ncbi:MAG: DNA mismatch repair protein MutS [Thermoprotei archaeon]
MKTFLMYKDRSLDQSGSLADGSADLLKDLGFEVIISSMSNGNKFIEEVSRKAMVQLVTDSEDLAYRQEVIKDALENSTQIIEMYNILTSAVEEAKERYFWASVSKPEFVLHESVGIIKIFVDALEKIRNILDLNVSKFRSQGFTGLHKLATEEFGADYCSQVTQQLKNLEFSSGIPVEARLGPGNLITSYKLINPEENGGGWSSVLSLRKKGKQYTFTLPDRDESGAEIMGTMRARAIHEVAYVLKSASEHVLKYIDSLRSELAFLVGAINLYAKTKEIGVPTSFPNPAPNLSATTKFRNLVDLALALKNGGKTVGNDLTNEGKPLIIVTGANRGGKSTFLRSLGQAQIMMQVGMFVAADEFSSSICSSIFTHFKREEDAGIRMGKFEEELYRLSQIVDNLKPGSLVLFNESFSSTNAVEGARIAEQVIDALINLGVRVVYVTHIFELGEIYRNKNPEGTLFLKAERKEDGTRTFKIIPGFPSETSYAMDVFRSVFNESV